VALFVGGAGLWEKNLCAIPGPKVAKSGKGHETFLERKGEGGWNPNKKKKKERGVGGHTGGGSGSGNLGASQFGGEKKKSTTRYSGSSKRQKWDA